MTALTTPTPQEQPDGHTKGPYRAEYGAIYHEDERGYLFTVDPPHVADALADSLNELHRLKNAAIAKALGQ